MLQTLYTLPTAECIKLTKKECIAQCHMRVSKHLWTPTTSKTKSFTIQDSHKLNNNSLR